MIHIKTDLFHVDAIQSLKLDYPLKMSINFQMIDLTYLDAYLLRCLAVCGENPRYCYSFGFVIVVIIVVVLGVQKFLTFCNISAFTKDIPIKLKTNQKPHHFFYSLVVLFQTVSMLYYVMWFSICL